jgi:hypothetical protein
MIDSGAWRKSSYSGSSGGNCVEIGDQDREVLVRDTKDRDGGALAFGTAAWAAFTGSLRK